MVETLFQHLPDRRRISEREQLNADPLVAGMESGGYRAQGDAVNLSPTDEAFTKSRPLLRGGCKRSSLGPDPISWTV